MRSGVLDEEGQDVTKGVALKAAYPVAHARIWMLAVVSFCALLAWNHPMTARVLGLGAAGAGRVIATLIMLFVANMIVQWVCGHYVNTILFSTITGRVYIRHHLQFRLAGGFTIPFIVNAIALAGVFWYFWSTSQVTPDPIATTRGLWKFLKWLAGAQLLLTIIGGGLAALVFRLRHGYTWA
ncbi:MAG: hypothetical protein HYX76_00050 [Acidobacteria bacterium]|nr:hypothetical protein [Acidobacteriota bacterium]